MMIHWPSYILGIVTIIIMEVIATIYLLRKFFKNKQDPEEEEKTVERLSEEYKDHVRGSE